MLERVDRTVVAWVPRMPPVDKGQIALPRRVPLLWQLATHAFAALAVHRGGRWTGTRCSKRRAGKGELSATGGVLNAIVCEELPQAAAFDRCLQLGLKELWIRGEWVVQDAVARAVGRLRRPREQVERHERGGTS
eukprot:scaffold43744_cov36-Phaeocystis_antarctica.AAC.2